MLIDVIVSEGRHQVTFLGQLQEVIGRVIEATIGLNPRQCFAIGAKCAQIEISAGHSRSAEDTGSGNTGRATGNQTIAALSQSHIGEATIALKKRFTLAVRRINNRITAPVGEVTAHGDIHVVLLCITLIGDVVQARALRAFEVINNFKVDNASQSV